MIPVKIILIYIKINITHRAVPGLSMCRSIENYKLKAPDIISLRIITEFYHHRQIISFVSEYH